MITGRAKPRFERSRTNGSDNITLHHHFRFEVEIVATAELGDVKPPAMKVETHKKLDETTICL
jgi:hypothetical protein